MLSFLFKSAVVVLVLMIVISNLSTTGDSGLAPDLAPNGLSATAAGEAGSTDGAAGLVTLAKAAVVDAAGFCERQPDACRSAGAAIADLGPRFVSLVESVAVTALGGGSAASTQTDGHPVQPHGTLTAEDLATDWSLPAAD